MSVYPRSALWHFCCRFGLVKAKPWGRPLEHLTREFVEPETAGLVKPAAFDSSLPTTENSGTLEKPGEHIEQVVIRPCLGKDFVALNQLRLENQVWLSRWETTLPPNENRQMPEFRQFCRQQDRAMCEGNALNMLVEVNGEVAGSVSIGAIHREALSIGTLGYWIAKKWANRGIITLAVAAVLDLALIELDLHRIEIVVRPENRPSLAVCCKLGLREEGLRRRYMYVNGDWCDHLTFVADQEMLQLARHTFVDRL